MVPDWRTMHKMQFWVRRGSDAHDEAGRVIEALRRDETVSCIGYRGSHNRLDHRVDRVLRDIEVLVRAELPAVQCNPYQRGRERVWVWSLGEPEAVAFWPRQEPEKRDVEIELQGAMPTPPERFPDWEFG
jgi:hypothetical protein